MCQIVAFTNLSKVKSQDKLTNSVAKHLSARQDDGFGYAAQGSQGVFGERTIMPKGFRTSFSQPIFDVPYVKQYYNRFGTKTRIQGAAIYHGRTSTNDATLRNTHPIIKHGWHLIHNGVVTNHGPKYEMITTNDTEHVLELLATEGISAVERQLSGYYAIAAFDGLGRLHIFRDSIATLYVARIETMDTEVFATSKNLIEEICEDMKWKHSVIAPMIDNTYLIFQGNELVSHTNINPRGSSYEESRLSEKSLGYSLGDSHDDLTGEGYPDGTIGNILDFSSRREAKESPLSEENSRYTIDEMEFLKETNEYADASYTFKDYRGNAMNIEDFKLLEADEQLYCTVIRGDGTVVDPEDYWTEKLYMGNI